MTTDQKIQELINKINANNEKLYPGAKAEIRALFLVSTPATRFLNFGSLYEEWTTGPTKGMISYIFNHVTPGHFCIRDVVNLIHKCKTYKELLKKF